MSSESRIIKSDGSVEILDPMKLAASLRRAGAGVHTAESIATAITRTAGKEVSSGEIYKKAFGMLRKAACPAAARYNLRRALLEFGPSGHPFEDFIAQLFKAEGWAIEWRKTVQGKCVAHEVDVYAKREGETLAAELKYHNDASYKTDIKIALYVKARFDDIWNCDPNRQTCPVDKSMLITNTKFTSQAVAYARCSGLELLGWSYPEQANLYDRIVESGLYPVTTITTLKKAEKRLLIDQGIVTTAMLLEHRDALRRIGVMPDRIGEIVAESNRLLEPIS